MRFDYRAYDGDPEDNDIIDGLSAENRSRKIQNLVTIEIKIELDRSKYEKVRAKYQTPIGKKILKMFE